MICTPSFPKGRKRKKKRRVLNIITATEHLFAQHLRIHRSRVKGKLKKIKRFICLKFNVLLYEMLLFAKLVYFMKYTSLLDE